jgi:hypothetical protein
MLRVGGEQSSQYVLSLVGNVWVLRAEFEVISALGIDHCSKRLDIIGWERKLTEQHLVEDHAYGPQIGNVRVGFAYVLLKSSKILQSFLPVDSRTSGAML